MNSNDSKKRTNYPKNKFNHKNNACKSASRNNFHIKNLSPAKKFQLRLRLEKFKKKWQNRDEYFEHDTRDNAQNKKNSNARKRKYYNNNNADKRNRPKKKIKRIQHKALILNGEENQDLKRIDNVNSVNAKSTVQPSHELTRALLNPETAKINDHSSTSSENLKCCCHCACARTSKKLRKPRRKLSSPYLGDFDVLHYNENKSHDNCSTKLTVMTTTTEQQHQQEHHHFHHHKYIEKSGNSLNEKPKIMKFTAHKVIEKKTSIDKKIFKNGKRLFL